MHETAVQELDRAAQTLLRALEQYSGELTPYLEAGQGAALRADVIAFRRALLGVQMGALYWDAPADLVAEALADPAVPVPAAAERVAQHFKAR
ncbi:MAG: hypothetical protein KA764_11200 [Anaerolineales bacterium]|nr:hypothetical protein [Anaerolineales bacterium]